MPYKEHQEIVKVVTSKYCSRIKIINVEEGKFCYRTRNIFKANTVHAVPGLWLSQPTAFHTYGAF